MRDGRTPKSADRHAVSLMNVSAFRGTPGVCPSSIRHTLAGGGCKIRYFCSEEDIYWDSFLLGSL